MPDIVIAGATFRNVPQIDIPKEGSGTASFVYEEGTKQITQNGTGIDVSGYAAVDVAVPSSSPVIQSLSVTQNGEYTAPSGVDGYSPITVNVSGGGGASNVVIGEFTASADNAAQDVNIPYTGNGYIVSLKIGIKGGINSPNATYASLVRRYAVGLAFLDKNNYSNVPTYAGNAVFDTDRIVIVYKSSTSSSTSYTVSYNSAPGYNDVDAIHSTSLGVRIRSKNKLSIYSTTVESTNYGFLKGQTYEYVAVYSE